ncbi:hypothetical protein [Enterovirga sp.]|uniref:hypothetical protein n=1 Tax=Enterovirga sp. TaxID=2026350 RepID=UPI002C8083E2|nr:hypothetical protein [Enterovirga sp.]HMO30920.1 hypothetical protein [Enterovirga sp.]
MSGRVWSGSAAALVLAFVALILFDSLAEFPLYFFCDEAVQGAEAQSLLAHGADRAGVAWPLFFRGHGGYQLSLSVYWLLPFQWLFGMSEGVVRASHAVASLIGVAGAMAFMRRYSPRTLAWLCVPLVFYGSPLWYLHSRTGFEAVISASAWLVCLAACPDLTHRNDRDRSRGHAEHARWGLFLIAFALCFYGYTPARAWAPLTLAALVLSQAGRGFDPRRALLLFGLAGLVMAPFAWTALTRPEVALARLYEVTGAGGAPVGDRARAALLRLFSILSPTYWFDAQTRFESWERHTIPGTALIPPYYLPFALTGLVACLVRFRSDERSRALVLLFPVGVFPGIFVDISPLRCLPVALVYLLWSAVGVSVVLGAMSGSSRARAYGGARFRDPAALFTPAIVLALGLHVVALHAYATTTAPLSYQDYGFYGVQSGEREVFREARRHADRQEAIRITHAAFNGNEALVDFYLSAEQRRYVTIADAGKPCIVAGPGRELWILRAERWREFKSAVCDVDAQELLTIPDPRGDALFVVAALTQRPTMPASR